MNWLDGLIIFVVLICMFLGYRRGLLGTLIMLGGIVLAIVMAGWFYSPVANWLSNYLESWTQARVAAFIVIFVGIVVVALTISWLLDRFLSLAHIAWLNKLGGLVIGLVIGALVWGAVLSLIVKFPWGNVERTVRSSAIADFLLDKFPFVLYLLPNDFEGVRRLFT